MAGDVVVFIGEQRFLRLADETTWGVNTGLTYYDVPVSDFTVRNKPKRRNGQSRVGRYQSSYGANTSAHPSGNLVTPLFTSQPATGNCLAQTLLAWAFGDQEAKFPASKAALWEYANHEDDKGYTGLRVNQASLAGSDAGIVLTIELIGQTAVNITGADSPPNTRGKLIQMLFEDCVFTLGGTALPISAFQWSMQKTLDVIYENSSSPISMPKTTCKETFSATPIKSSTAYDVMRESLGMQEMAASLVIKGLNNAGTFTGTTCTISFPRLSLIDSDESGGLAAVMNPLTFDVLKPDTTSNGSSIAWA